MNADLNKRMDEFETEVEMLIRRLGLDMPSNTMPSILAGHLRRTIEEHNLVISMMGD